MSILNLTIQEDDSFTGLIQVQKLDADDEPVTRKITKSASLSSILEQVSNGKLNLGKIEINLDFDEQGELVQIEIYS